MIEELSSSTLLEPTAKRAKLEGEQQEDSFSSISEEEESPEDLLEEAFQKDDDGPICCVCQRYSIQLLFLEVHPKFTEEMKSCIKISN